MENDDYITDTMKRFKLVDMRERYPELIREAEQKQIGYKEWKKQAKTRTSSGSCRI